jgi:hypothetical protein
MDTLQAKDLVKGQTVETSKGIRTVKRSGFQSEKLWRLEFWAADGVNWDICLCRHDHPFSIATEQPA